MSIMEKYNKVRVYKDRIRILLIIYFFSEDFSDPSNPEYKKVLRSEVKIQKIDFLLRNPDYLAYELLDIATEDDSQKNEIKTIIKDIFNSNEPVLRRLDMERFFFGAYEDIDDIIGFLKGLGLIGFSSKKRIDLKTIEKRYFVTKTAINKIESALSSFKFLQWYIDRCLLIKKFFGNLTGTQLKVSQYKIDEYNNTTYRNYIETIETKVKEKFYSIYSEKI